MDGKTPKEKEIERIKHTIILWERLPRAESMRARWYADNNKLTEELIIKLLKDAGHILIKKKEISMVHPKEFQGIKITTSNQGYMICPKEPKDYSELMNKIIEAGLFYHPCKYPNPKHPKSK